MRKREKIGKLGVENANFGELKLFLQLFFFFCHTNNLDLRCDFIQNLTFKKKMRATIDTDLMTLPDFLSTILRRDRRPK